MTDLEEKKKERKRDNYRKWYLKNREKRCNDVREWRLKNKDRVRETGRQWHLKNRDRKNETSREWRKNNKEHFATLCRNWRHRNRDRVRASVRKFDKENPEVLRCNVQKRRARVQNAAGSFTKHDLAEILKMQKNRCANPGCRKRIGEKYHIDHIQPLSRGGTNYRSNIQILCPPCNLSKHSRDPIEFARTEYGLLL